MLSRRYFIYLTKIFGSVNKIFGRIKKTIQAKTLVDSSKRVWLTEQKFGRLNQNVLCNQPNTVNQTILLDEPFFFWVWRTVVLNFGIVHDFPITSARHTIFLLLNICMNLYAKKSTRVTG